MKHFSNILLVILLSTSTLFAQPRYSGEVRAQKEMDWLKDSLHLSKDQLAKAAPVVIDFQQQMDKAGENPATREKVQQHLMKKKDADMKRLLSAKQYQKYYKNELIIRRREKTVYKDGRQPM